MRAHALALLSQAQCLVKFDEGRYWAQRGNRYTEEFAGHDAATDAAFRTQERELRAALRQHDLSAVRSVLEIGCGFGRLTPILIGAIPQVRSYLGLDVSPGQVAAAAAALPGVMPSGEVRLADFRTADLTERADLVFAGEVFLHFPPDEIRTVLRRATDVGARYLIHLDPYLPRRPLSTRARLSRQAIHRVRRLPLRWDWDHDYPRMYPVERVERVTMHPILEGRQHLFVVSLVNESSGHEDVE